MEHEILVLIWGERGFNSKATVIDEHHRKSDNLNVFVFYPTPQILEQDDIYLWRPFRVVWSYPQSLNDLL